MDQMQYYGHGVESRANVADGYAFAGSHRTMEVVCQAADELTDTVRSDRRNYYK